MDYGAGIYDPCTRTSWRPIELLQNGALRIILGAMPSSPIPALHVEAAFMPVRLRARTILTRMVARWRMLPQHPAAFLSHQLAVTDRCRRYYQRAPPLLQQVCRDAHLPPLRIGPQTPWPCYTLPWRAWVEPLPITSFFPPAPVSGPTEPGTVYRMLRTSHWRTRHILATDGSRSDDPVSVGAAF